jgi:mannitol-specific phosphotransferase system IIBC component
MGHYDLRLLGGLVIWVFKKFKKTYNECFENKHSAIIGVALILFIFYAIIFIMYLFHLFDNG